MHSFNKAKSVDRVPDAVQKEIRMGSDCAFPGRVFTVVQAAYGCIDLGCTALVAKRIAHSGVP